MNETEPESDFAATIAAGRFGSQPKGTETMNDQLNARVLGCTYGQYPWDDWERAALPRGVEKKLANLGRAVMREACQHDWESRLQKRCGWEDGGAVMIALALRAPRTARRRWERLLDTDGGRGSYHPKTGEWISRQ